MLKECIRENKELFKYIVEDIEELTLNEFIEILCNEITIYEENCYSYELSIFRLLDYINDMFKDEMLCNKDGETIHCDEIDAFGICELILDIYKENFFE